MTSTPKSLRLHIALLGRTNTGKSSFLNLLTGQDVSIVSEQPGTTTDVVEKAMELLPIGPVLFIDTAGLDDSTVLGGKRLEQTAKVFDRADVILLICEGTRCGEFEQAVAARAAENGTPLIRIANKADLSDPSDPSDPSYLFCTATDPGCRERVLTQLKTRLLAVCPDEFLQPPPLLGDLLRPGGIALLIVPIDLQAPKGRLIPAQVSTIRDALDHDAVALVVKENDYTRMLAMLREPPDLVVCDSQVVLRMAHETPPQIPCTTFSILFARLKGDLPQLAAGARAIARLRHGDKVLFAESCTHHPTEDDIGRVKIPRWLRQHCGCDLHVDVHAGHDFPANLGEYRLVVQCGGCMHNRREILSRIQKCQAAGVPITNYGICISQTQGVLRRVLSPFPDALAAFERSPS